VNALQVLGGTPGNAFQQLRNSSIGKHTHFISPVSICSFALWHSFRVADNFML
jgi:hypothetical protein